MEASGSPGRRHVLSVAGSARRENSHATMESTMQRWKDRSGSEPREWGRSLLETRSLPTRRLFAAILKIGRLSATACRI